jgi:D-tyrosyl-tRNA(Tyr) deacylase
MRLVAQRVNSASVSVSDKIVGKISKGLFILVGVSEDDKKENADYLAEKVAKLRVMSDKENKMNLSISETGGSVLAVSQFTLHADTSKGNRPSFIKAAEPKLAWKIYDYFIQKLKEKGVKVETGEFGEYMVIDAELDGPVTIILEK